MLPGVTSPTATQTRNLARMLGTDAALVELFDSGGPLAGDTMPGPVWHLATCHRCGEDLSQPFLDATARDAWAVAHVASSGHAVVLSTAEPGHTHPAAILRHGVHLWTWICAGCALTGNEAHASGVGHESGQLALAAFRAHRCQP
jgi:hypothetical protein